MYREFTWFKKLTRVLETIPDDLKGQWSVAVINYGTQSIEPDFSEWGLVCAFEGVRDDIDRSANARSNRGGRPKSSSSEDNETQGEERLENLPEQGGTTGFETSNNPQTEKVTGGFETPDNPSLYIDKGIGIGKDKGIGKGRGTGKGKRFKPPTETELQNFITENNLNVDVQRFIDFYASKGWKVGSSPMKDWKAAARNWSRRESKEVQEDDELRELAANF